MEKDSSKDKKVYLSLVKNGEVFKKQISYEEAKENGLFEATAYKLDAELEKKANMLEMTAADGELCEVCGFSLQNFEKYGRFGCPSCYDTFHRPLMPILKRMHLGAFHLGKVPDGGVDVHVLERRIEYFNRKIGAAVRVENYEEAVLWRDEIKRLEELLEKAEANEATSTKSEPPGAATGGAG